MPKLKPIPMPKPSPLPITSTMPSPSPMPIPMPGPGPGPGPGLTLPHPAGDPAPAPTATRTGCWIAVACASHVQRGQAEGFMQVGHGKGAPLRRLLPGDRVVYYSPTVTLGGNDRLRAFTALGTVMPREPYQADMGDGFVPWRRDVAWLASQPAPITPLLPLMDFSAGKRNWAYPMRFGLFAISAADMDCIAQAMAVSAPV